MAKNYIAQLIKDRKLGEFERSLELGFALDPIKAVAFRHGDLNEVIVVLTDRYFKLIKGYKVTEFNIRPIPDSALPYEFKDIRKSQIGCDDEDFKRFYLRFMAKRYNTFAADYKSLREKQTAYDLGEITTL